MGEFRRVLLVLAWIHLAMTTYIKALEGTARDLSGDFCGNC